MSRQTTQARTGGRAGCIALVAVALALASGCGRGMDDLEAYVDDVKARPGGRIEPLPEISPAPTYTYAATLMRSPFQPDAPVRTDSGVRPEEDRPRQFLEQFPLDTMRMVGTLDLAGQTFGLLQTQDGLVHRVTSGNYVGQNDGRITEITDSEIRLVEIVSDGMGGYLERPAAMALSSN